jgi:hypothetical protein
VGVVMTVDPILRRVTDDLLGNKIDRGALQKYHPPPIINFNTMKTSVNLRDKKKVPRQF